MSKAPPAKGSLPAANKTGSVIPPVLNQDSRLSGPPTQMQNKNRSIASQSQNGDLTSPQNELELIILARFETFILKPQHIAKIWDSSHMKEDFIVIFQEYFKPKSSIEQEKVEYNEINIFSEYQLYNLIFAKNELLLSNYKCGILLDKFWKLLEFNPDANTPNPEGEDRQSIVGDLRASRMNSAQASQHHEDLQEQNPEEKFADLLRHKFELFKSLCLEMINEPESKLKFTTEEVKRIADYAKDSYFKHLRLYDYVLNNKQLCEVKRMNIQMNSPIIANNLNDALLLGSEEMLVYADEDEELRLEIIRKKQELAQQRKEEEERKARQALEAERDDESDEELRGLDERLKHANIHKESKLIIHEKISGLDNMLTKTMDEKQRILDEKMTAAGIKKK